MGSRRKGRRRIGLVKERKRNAGLGARGWAARLRTRSIGDLGATYRLIALRAVSSFPVHFVAECARAQRAFTLFSPTNSRAGEDVVPLIGTKRRDRLADALGALDATLSPDDLALLERAVPADAVAGTRYPASAMYGGEVAEDFVVVADPLYGPAQYTYAEFRDAYRGDGIWTHTYRCK
jgi:hypothetical protein